MKKTLIILSLLIISSCDKSLKSKDFDDIHRKKLYSLVFDTPVIRNNLIQLFEIDDKSPKIFKIVTTRRNHFTRITITQIFYEFEIEELPFSYMRYKKNLFLNYNGMEMILNESMDRKQLYKILSELKIELKTSSIYDSRILQFDLFPNGNIKINNPPIDPYEQNKEKIKFIRKPK